MHRGTISPRAYLSSSYALASRRPPLPSAPQSRDAPYVGWDVGADAGDDGPVPSLHDLVERHLSAGVAAWRALDLRRIREVANPGPSRPTAAGTGPGSGPISRGYRSGRAHFSLPDNFDVTCSREEDGVGRGESGGEVLNYDGSRESYEEALRRIFEDLPTYEEMRRERRRGMDDDARSVMDPAIKFRQEMEDSLTNNEKRANTSDEASVVRQRKAHGFLEVVEQEEGHAWTWDGAGTRGYYAEPEKRWEQRKRRRREKEGETRREYPIVQAEEIVIRIEIWKRRLKKSSAPDANRLEMEFLGSQTLEDVHRAVVGSLDLSYGNLGGESNIPNAGGDVGICELLSGSRLKEKTCRSGLFAVEDALYPFGPDNYASAVLRWLRCEDDDPAIRTNRSILRHHSLGLSNPAVCPAASATLADLPLRLGVRYALLLGRFECALFFSDVRLRRPGPGGEDILHPTRSFPTTLDPWGSEVWTCEACERLAAVVMVCDDKLTDGEPAALCPPCLDLLHYDHEGNLRKEDGGFRIYPIDDIEVGKDMIVDQLPPGENF